MGILLTGDLVKVREEYAEVLQNSIDSKYVIVQKENSDSPEICQNEECSILYTAQAVDQIGSINKAIKQWENTHNNSVSNLM